MLRGAAGKVMWVGRATVFLVGLAVILALVFGAASTALGANGGKFILGKTNFATSVSTLVKQGAGPALSLQVESGSPLQVNSSTKVSNLNADTVDGKDSSAFATTQVEAWHEVGTEGEPALQPGYSLAPFRFGDSLMKPNSPAFYKDPFGVVHLKGSVRNDAATVGRTIFTLPAGYRPAAVELQSDVDGIDNGWVYILPTGEVSMVWPDATMAYLDGITFRAAN